MAHRLVYDELVTSRLGRLHDPTKTPLILVACGSFSPVTNLHMRMFEMARDHANGFGVDQTSRSESHASPFEVVGAYLSPVNDRYNKARLAYAEDRLNMCECACKEESDWVAVDRWEASQSAYVPTARVLDHFDHEINDVRGGIHVSDGTRRRARIMLLAGSDLIQTMSEPGIWQEKDLHHILSRYGCYIIERNESQIDWSLFESSAVHSRSPLALYMRNIYKVPQPIRNDVSSTKIRLLLDRGQSVDYLIPGSVCKYIRSKALYRGRLFSRRSRPPGVARQAAGDSGTPSTSQTSAEASTSGPSRDSPSQTVDGDAAVIINPQSYTFSASRLNRLRDPRRTPLVFIACGSFSPITFLHLRMFEMARDHAREDPNAQFEVVGAYFSPVNDAYNKAGLAPAVHRLNMIQLACNKTSDWLSVDSWEADQPGYLPTARVLDHFDYEINEVHGGVEIDGEYDDRGEPRRKKARIVLLAGSDLIQTMSEPGIWAEKDVRGQIIYCVRSEQGPERGQLHHILGKYGCYIIERPESHIDWSLFDTSPIHSRSPLALYKDNIFRVNQLVRNDVSSTKVRLFLRRGMSVEYLIPGIVVKYIRRHHLYSEEDQPAGPSPLDAAVPHTAPGSPKSDVGPSAPASPEKAALSKGAAEDDSDESDVSAYSEDGMRVRPPPPTLLSSRPPGQPRDGVDER